MYSETMQTISGEIGNDPSTEDAFKKMEKQIRKYFLNQQSTRSRKRRRGKKNEMSTNSSSQAESACTAAASDDQFDPDLLVDPLNYSDDNRLCRVGVGATFILNEASGGPQGLYILSQVLSLEQQFVWASTALVQYSATEYTNLTNLKHLRERQSTLEDKESSALFPNDKKIMKESPVSIIDAVSSELTVDTLWSRSLKENNNLKAFRDLRWVSLGYHYDWTARRYNQDVKSPFPADLSELCQSMAHLVDPNMEFTPEAAIVNYYPVSSVMGGHLDDAELTMDKPIVSISLGRPAIFLIGGRTKQTTPIPILVRSGDVIIMSGESRYCYHGVPHILSVKNEQDISMIINPREEDKRQEYRVGEDISQHTNSSSAVIKESISVLASTASPGIYQYLESGRININVRQVVPADGIWVDKCGTGSMQSMKPEFLKV